MNTQNTPAPELREALQRLINEVDVLFTHAADCIVNTGDGWMCKSCGMELDTGGGHSDSCCASKILDLNLALHFAEDALIGIHPPQPSHMKP